MISLSPGLYTNTMLIVTGLQASNLHNKGPHTQDGAHEMCRLPRSVLPFHSAVRLRSTTQARDAVSHSAMSLRTQISKLPCKHRNRPYASNSHKGPHTQDGAHEMCRLPRSVLPFHSAVGLRSTTQTRDAVSHSAMSLRTQISKLPCKRPQIRGGAQGRAPPPLRQGWRIWREPRTPQ